MPFCPNCGKPVEEDQDYCSGCGHSLKQYRSEQETMYCSSCGEKILRSADVCPKCGNVVSARPAGRTTSAPVPITPWGNRVAGERNAGVAVLLSILIMGAGTIYAGRIARGIGLFLSPILFLFLGFVMVATGEDSFAIAGLFVMFVPPIFLYFYAIYDAYHSCKIINELWYGYLNAR